MMYDVSFLDLRPKLKVVTLLSCYSPKMAKICDCPWITTCFLETEILFWVGQMVEAPGALVRWQVDKHWWSKAKGSSPVCEVDENTLLFSSKGLLTSPALVSVCRWFQMTGVCTFSEGVSKEL